MKIIKHNDPYRDGQHTLWILVDGKPTEGLTHHKDIERHRLYAEGFGERLYEMSYTASDFNFFCRKIRHEFEDVDTSNDNVRQMVEISAASLTAYALHRRYKSVAAWRDITEMEEKAQMRLAVIRNTRDRILHHFETMPDMEKHFIPII